jgi:hypothetical protein
MKKKIALFFLIVLNAHFLFSQTPVEPIDGDGSIDNPYQITSWENLYWVSQDVSRWNKHYIQYNDIVFPSEINNWDENRGWSPIGNASTNFTGSYDGGGYTISNLFFSRNGQTNCGFFGYISVAEISNLNITSSSNLTGGDKTGMLAGNSIHSTITNCHITGNTISGGWHVGGLTGSIESTSISQCSSDCLVIGSFIVGGIAGTVKTQSFIELSYCTDTVYAGGDVCGGFVGEISASTISNCYSNAIVKGWGTYQYYNFYGFAARISENPTIEYCYSKSDIILDNYDEPVINGFAASSAGIFTSNFCDTTSSNQDIGIGAVNSDSTSMRTQTLYLNAAWDFVCETENGANDYWSINPEVNDAYPFLTWQGYDFVDNVLPTIYCIENQEITLLENETFYTITGTEFDPTSFYDNCNGVSISNNFNASSSLNGIQLAIGNNTIEWTATDAASNTSSCITEILVNAYMSIDALTEFDITFYPNPATNSIIFDIYECNNFSLDIIDITGKVVFSQENIYNGDEIDLSTLKKGLWLVRLNKNNMRLYKKLVIE